MALRSKVFVDNRAHTSEPTESMLFSDEAVRNSPFFQDVVGLRFGDQADEATLDTPSLEIQQEDYQYPQYVLETYAQLPELIHLIHASDFVGASDNWIKEKARSMGAELKVPLEGTRKEVITYRKETLLELYKEFHSIPMQTTELTLNELERRTGMKREVLAVKLPILGAVTLERRSILNNRAATFYEESAEDLVREYIESLPLAPDGWKTARAVGTLLGMGEARATRLLAPFESQTTDFMASNHVLTPHYPPHAVEHAVKEAGVEQEVPYATDEDIALGALAKVMGKHQSWITNRLPYVEVSTVTKRNPVNNRTFTYFTPNPRRALEALPENVLKANPNEVILEAKRKERRDRLSMMALQLGDQQKLIRTLKLKLDRLNPAAETQTQTKMRSIGRVPAKVSLPIPALRGTDESEDWRNHANCAQTDPEAFFPEKGGSSRDAKKICSSCDVAAQCLEYALDHDERFGIWGGLSERERRKLRPMRTS